MIAAERETLLSAHDQESAPDRVFERHWALNVTARALERVRAEYEVRGQSELFDSLRPLLTSDSPGAAAAESPADEGPADPARRTALHRARKRFAEALRKEIRETVSDSSDVDDELRFLLRALTE
jgi:RNA polymerase sigma-70 factor (ECF subfamily)